MTIRPPDPDLLRRLADARGRRVVFLSHCLLNENVRYLGGAFHAGSAPVVLPLIEQGLGLCQMPCPEMHAWGGVDKRLMLLAYGLRGTRLYRFRRPLFRLFVLHTRHRYRRLARSVAHDVAQYVDAGVEVVAITGVSGSPSCGVRTTMNLERAFNIVATCPLAQIDRTMLNRDIVMACRIPGEGLFVTALRRRLRKLRIEPTVVEYELAGAVADGPSGLCNPGRNT